jgi:hypothetical protein
MMTLNRSTLPHLPLSIRLLLLSLLRPLRRMRPSPKAMRSPRRSPKPLVRKLRRPRPRPPRG